MSLVDRKLLAGSNKSKFFLFLSLRRCGKWSLCDSSVEVLLQKRSVGRRKKKRKGKLMFIDILSREQLICPSQRVINCACTFRVPVFTVQQYFHFVSVILHVVKSKAISFFLFRAFVVLPPISATDIKL